MTFLKYHKKVIHRNCKTWIFPILIAIIYIFPNYTFSQSYWQQRINYDMDIDFDAANHHFKGLQTVTYHNNSPDTLDKVYYHLYYNAFQPGSMMDVYSRNIPDPDSRIRERIFNLQENEIGYHKIKNLRQEKENLEFKIKGTIMEVLLHQALIPGDSTMLTMEFESQIPLQIRRTGRHNKEGIDYSMSQWYPKMAEYDEMGWHTHPYVQREFYAPWGDFNVNISIDSRYVLGGTGVILNKSEVGHGYQDKKSKVKHKQEKLTWKFSAKNVHDFVWAADPDYTLLKDSTADGIQLYFLYQKSSKTKDWSKAPSDVSKIFEFIQNTIGEYPYPQYSIIQGGDGGMEYPMATLINGERSLSSLIGVITHELLHSWFQGILATNESYYAWMDEGFTEYFEAETLSFLYNKGQKKEFVNNVSSAYKNYFAWSKAGLEEPMITHADHFSYNSSYRIAAYTKGAVTLQQLKYVIGNQNLTKGIQTYYNKWKFKHPDRLDFTRVMEKVSNMELDWYFEYWINTTHTIDYGVENVIEIGDSTQITLEKFGRMPMPIDLWVTKKDGSKHIYYIPLDLMWGEKPNEFGYDRKVLDIWPWTHPQYTLNIDIPISEIARIEIDASQWMADINRKNNVFSLKQ